LVAFIGLNTVINYLGISLTAKVNKIMLVGELIALAIFLVVGISAVAAGKGAGFSFDAFFNPATFSWSLVFGAASIAVLSFLGFDAISTLAEENSGSAKSLGRSMIGALLVVGTLFIAQTWVASMLVTDPASLIKNGDPTGVAFYQASETAGGHWMFILTAVSTAIAWGFANALVAQAATARLIFAMARDGQLPKFLSKVDTKRQVPWNATLLVVIVSLALGIYLTLLPDGLVAISALVNFGAIVGFMLLNASVIWWFFIKQKSGRVFVHLIYPALGILVLAFVLWNARAAAQILGIGWLIVGIIVAVILRSRGKDLSVVTE
jgi:amino acid transporter